MVWMRVKRHCHNRSLGVKVCLTLTSPTISGHLLGLPKARLSEVDLNINYHFAEFHVALNCSTFKKICTERVSKPSQTASQAE